MERFDLLEYPLFSTRDRAGAIRRRSLPDVLTALGADEISAFTHVRAHQESTWHAFLVQLGAIATHAAGLESAVQDGATWRAALLGLSGGRRDAFSLIVPDLTQPAFLQPPVPEGSLDVLPRVVATPDALDLLLTSKNHENKAERIDPGDIEAWVYALVCLQTTQGFLGRGNYGVSRMKGGFGSRPSVGFVASMGWGGRFVSEVEGLGRVREEVCDTFGCRLDGGLALVWLEPWDGVAAVARQDLDPWYIEVCRRVRFVTGSEGLICRTGPSQAPRIRSVDGEVAASDPWAPVDAEGQVLTVGPQGLHYKLLRDLLLTDAFSLPPLSREIAGRRFLHATVLVRGQGVTEGLHERLIPLPRALAEGASEAWWSAARGLATARVEAAAKIRSSVLYPALRQLLDPTEKKPRRDDRPSRWLDRLDDEIDRAFFPMLWSDLERWETPEWREEADRRWEEHIRALAQAQLQDAIGSVPYPSVRRYRAIAQAETLFDACFRKQFNRPEMEVAS